MTDAGNSAGSLIAELSLVVKRLIEARDHAAVGMTLSSEGSSKQKACENLFVHTKKQLECISEFVSLARETVDGSLAIHPDGFDLEFAEGSEVNDFSLKMPDALVPCVSDRLQHGLNQLRYHSWIISL